MLIAARSRGRPTSVLRTESTMNSSSSLPTDRDSPRTRLPAAWAAFSVPSAPPSLNATGFRKASNNRMSFALPSALKSTGRVLLIDVNAGNPICPPWLAVT